MGKKKFKISLRLKNNGIYNKKKNLKNPSI